MSIKIEDGVLAGSSGLAKLGRPRQFGARQQHPVRRFGGIAVVLLLHVVLIYALVNGLATKVVQVIQHPIETRIIEPVKPPPPPPPMPVVKLPPPKVALPPPPFVPPPEVPVQAPSQSTITHQAAPVPSAPAVQAPVVAPAVPAAKPVSHEVGVVCPNSEQMRAAMQYPKEAQENNITGDVTIEFVVDAEGNITGERVAQSADPILDRAAYNTVKRFKCMAQGQAVRVQVPFSFNLN